MSKKEEFWKAVHGDKTLEQVLKENEERRRSTPVSVTGREIGIFSSTYLDPRYKKYRNKGIYKSSIVVKMLMHYKTLEVHWLMQ